MSGTNYIASNWRVPENSNSSKNDNYSLSFDPADTEYVACGNDPQIQLTGDISISIWFKAISGSTATMILAAKRDSALGGTSRGWQVYCAGGNIKFLVDRSGAPAADTVTGPLVNDGQWHHVVCTIDQSSEISIILDGIPVASQTLAPGTFVDSGSELRIGYNQVGSANYYFDGDISEVALFDYILDTEQISTLRGDGTLGAGNPMVLKPTPVAYYPLGDNSSGGIDVGPTSILTQPNVSVDDASVFDFDPSVPNYIDCGTLPYFETAQTSFSISFWFNQNAVGGQAFSIGNRIYFIIQSNRIQCWNIGPTTGRADTTGDVYSISTWYHFMCTYDGTGATDSDKFKVWINGVPNTLNFVTSPPVSTLGTSARTTIASNFNNSSSANIKMSNVAIWSTDETDEVSNIYNDGIPATSYTNTPLAWYKLDQSANWEADTSGDWQIPNAVSAYPQSFNFNGTSQYILNGNKIAPTTGITISAWVKTTVTSGLKVIVCEDRFSTTPNRDWGFVLNSSRKLQFYVKNPDGSGANSLDARRAAADEINDGKWHHVCGTWDGTTDVGAAKLSVDGDVETFTATAAGIKNTAPFPTAIGSTTAGTAYWWDGEMSSVQIWDASIGDAEIEALYNNGTPLTTAIQSADLKAWWKLDDTALFDNTNWSVANEVYTSNYESALRFNTSESDYVQLPTSTFVFPNEFTLSIWVNPTVLSNNQVILGNGSSSQNWIRIPSSSQITFNLAGASITFNESGLGTNFFALNRWQHILFVRDSSNNITVYRDGETFGAVLNNTNTLTISSIGYRGLIHYDGLISNVAFWDSDQTAEKANIYNSGNPATSYTNTPTSWWKLNNLTTGLQDSGSGGNNATNNGTTVANTFVSTESATSANMTEQSLVNNNVSTLNGESSGMTSGNLVLSDLTRNLPYENYSMAFDGTEYIETTSTFSLLDGQTSATFSMWIKPTAVNIFQYLFSIVRSAINTQFQVACHLDDLARIRVYGDTTSKYTYSNTGVVSAGVWTHLCITFDLSQPVVADRVVIYVNGVDETNAGFRNMGITQFQTSTSGFSIARNQNNNLPEFEGLLSQFSVFNSTLTSTEVLKLYANGLPQDLTNFTPQPDSWWTLGKESFWNGSDWIVRDMISSNDGTSSNMAVSDLIGDAPRSEANGTGTNMDIPTNLVGNAGFSDKNAYSINMSPSARVTDTP
jgi:hypothetical protein